MSVFLFYTDLEVYTIIGTASSPKQKTVIESTTDPESGVFHKGEHKKCFAYEAHTVCDRRGYVLETEVTPGNAMSTTALRLMRYLSD